MSKFLVKENSFIGVQEFKRAFDFLSDDGYKKIFKLTNGQPGIVLKDIIVDDIDLSESFRVVESNNPNKIKILPGIAVDKNGNFIILRKEREIEIPNNNNFYSLSISRKTTHKEKGKVSIDLNGNVVGDNTVFTEIFRGHNLYPNRIKFLNSQNGNIQDYEIIEVIDNTHMIIAGDFNPEQDLEFAVIGTFVDGYAYNQGEIYEFDDCKISLFNFTISASASSPISMESYFGLANIKNNGTTIEIYDKRSDFLKDNLEKSLTEIPRNSNNYIIGVENIKFDTKGSTMVENLMKVEWRFKITSWSYDSNQNQITILNGYGGKIKDVSQTFDNIFNGWRIYGKDGSYAKIIASEKNGSNLSLTIDVFDLEKYQGFNPILTPDFEQIEIKTSIFKNGLELKNSIKIDKFNIADDSFIRIKAVEGGLAKVSFRYKTLNDYSKWNLINDDSIGFDNEFSFDENGNFNANLPNAEKVPYEADTVGFIPIIPFPQNYEYWINLLNTGEKQGVETVAISNSTPVMILEVGVNKRYQHYKAPEITLSGDVFINLKRKDNQNNYFEEGVQFFLHFEQFINLNGFKIRIVEDFIDPTNYTLLAELTDNDTAFIKNNVNTNNGNNIVNKKGLFVTATFNEFNHWIINYVSDTTPKGTIRMVKEANSSWFNSQGEGIIPGFFGWKRLVGMQDVFPVGEDDFSKLGDIDGENEFTIENQNLPQHRHHFSGETDEAGRHDHDLRLHSGVNGRAVPHGGSYNTGYTLSNAGINHAGEHTHDFSGVTDYTGEVNPTAIDKRPKRIKLLFLEKIV